eukprot:gnl/MRDRNA2_/MRDRNA2_86671_c1_seq1.p1 gnl/MRDRNA2_/MRDRNA2_86671_c1~~gnl/MRDRNA2_/MRDRNA2_86671_c1_seq1.p1  ORF type:complete len:126 (-),score=3.68 gnl/MRDRNA2_/MRDRNA2_86671_c1_seq1:28-405(-)
MMEWRSILPIRSKQRIVRNIFEKGLDRFSNEAHYLNAYISWLIAIGEECSAKSLFERTLQQRSPFKSYVVWGKYLGFLASRGDMLSYFIAEQRMIKALLSSRRVVNMALFLTENITAKFSHLIKF